MSQETQGLQGSFPCCPPQPRLRIKRASLALGGRAHTSAAALYFDPEQALSSPGLPPQLQCMQAGVDLGLQAKSFFSLSQRCMFAWVLNEKR